MNLLKKLLLLNNNHFSDISIAMIIVRLWLGLMMIRYTYTILWSPSEMNAAAMYLKGMNFPMPIVLAYLLKSAEFFGGAFIVLGLFSRIGATLLVINFLVAVFIANGNNILGAGGIGV